MGASLVAVCGLLTAVEWALGHTGFSSRGEWAQLPCRIWDLPGSGTELVSPALEGGFFYH